MALELGNGPTGANGTPIFTFALSLHLKHPEMDPEEVTWILGIAPEGCTHVGEKRVSRNGRELGGVILTAICTVPFLREQNPG